MYLGCHYPRVGVSKRGYSSRPVCMCVCVCVVSRSQTLHPFLLIMTAGGESGGLSYTKLFPEVRRELGSPTQIMHYSLILQFMKIIRNERRGRRYG